ncbi:hypothetical protein OnM2_052078 [Erysiphe neolycopersici]|uniref:Uncharacterized protein n=1 Tax=Erysiphe neolycopersici TaxID=212602 RepID=A0A420HS73_9PEZI|nr:hypothetical protein OnM2_052078 [Erysiphe neolycopersici]
MVLTELYSEEEMSDFVSEHKYVVVCVYYKKRNVPKSFIKHLGRRYSAVRFAQIDSANLSYWCDSNTSEKPEYYLYVNGNIPDDMITITQHNIEKLIKDHLR